MPRRSSYRKNTSKSQLAVIWVVSIALLGGCFYFLTTKNRTFLSGISNQVFGFTSGVINAPFRWLSGGGNYIASYFSNAETVRKLRDENQALLEWRDEAKALAMRLQQYEELNSIKGEQVVFSKSGRMVAEINGPFSQSGIINLGTDDGISTDWVAINQNGMIGRVIATSGNTSRILLLTDTQSRISVMGEETRGRAILIGDKTSAPLLSPLNTPNILKNGERIITSGDDGIIPRGITIGYAGVAPDKKWRVRLNVNKEAIDFVKLLKPTNIIAPVDRVTNPKFAPPNAAQIAPATADNAANQILENNDGNAGLPAANTPSAIAHAQEIRKLKEERDKALDTIKRQNAAAKTDASKKSDTKATNNAKNDNSPKPKIVDLTAPSDNKPSKPAAQEKPTNTEPSE